LNMMLNSCLVEFPATANLKTESTVNKIEGLLWFTVVNVVLKTQMTQRYAPTAVHHFTQSVSVIPEANGNTTEK
jgi:hypothetical protein